MDLVRLERAEALAFADCWRAAARRLRERERIALLEDGTVTALSVASLSESRVHNHAYGVESLADVERVEAFYRECGSSYVLSTAPSAELDPALEARGYTRGYAWMKFARGLDSSGAETTLQVAEAGEKDGAAFGEVVATAFGMPTWTAEWIAALPGRAGWACFLARDGSRPAAAGALFRAGDVGWIGFDGTLPEFRGRGGQAALLAARVESARKSGCTALTCETGVRVEGSPSGSYRNILRAGFVEARARDNWVPPTPDDR